MGRAASAFYYLIFLVSVFENHVCFSSDDFGPDHILQGQMVYADGNLRSGGGRQY